MNTKNKIICGVVVAALCGGGFFWYQNNNKSTTQVTDEEMGYSRTFKLAKGDLESTVDVSGVVVSAVETEVTTDITAKVVKLNVKEGDKVKKGDIICVLDSSDIDRQIKDLQENKDTGGSGPSESAIQRAKDAITKAEAAQEAAQTRFNTRYTRDSEKFYKEIEEKYKKLDDELNTAYQDLLIVDKELDSAITEKEKADENYKDAESAWKENPTEENKENLDKAEEAKNNASANYVKASNNFAEKVTAKDTAQNNINDYATKIAEYEIYKTDKENLETTKDALLSAQEAYSSLFSGGGSSSSSNTELEKLQEQKANCTLRAESTGEITSLSVKLGSIAKGSVAIIQSTENLIFQVSIPEESINKVKTGLMATVKASSIDEPVTGKLTQISSTTGLTTSTEGGASSSSGDGSGYKAQITLDKPGGLHIGSKAQGSIILSSKKNIFVVPVDAVGNDEGLSFIRVCQEDGTYKKIAVEVGESNDTMIEISGDALVEGLEVLSDAYYEDLITEAKTSGEY